ncbi:hypothetical protein BDW42DRAFT_190365 [Aspergillus taichungensis]|uniref:Uncharacterized protein n=1 Tax=Aspergillus taichungensis TaxID=482145 RepID=A0A2J5I820_9EURO|nr:hypothetical protein BDW42DRAFT_190365 [Aspergillus taichungensis]
MRARSLLLFTFSLTPVTSWTLDSSCGSAHKQGDSHALIHRGMNQAIDMAQSALTTLHALKETTQHQGQLNLFSELFPPLVSHSHHHRPPQVAHDQPIYRAMEALFGGIAALRNPSADHAIPAIKVYCNFARVHEDHVCNGPAAPGTACDTDLTKEFPISPVYTECRTGQSPSLPVLPAETFGYASPHHHEHTPIQICRGYLDRIKALPDRNFVDTTPRLLVMQPAAMDRWIFSHGPVRNTPAYFDLVLLRELVALVQRETGPSPGNNSESAPINISPDSLMHFALGSVLLQAEDHLLAKQSHPKMTSLS